MREIEQVVVDQQVVRREVELATQHAIAGIVEPHRVGDRCRIGQRLVAHPDPHPAAALDRRKAPHEGAVRNELLARDFDAAPVRRELEPVIHTAQIVVLQPAHRERRETVAAAVLQDNDLAIGLAVKRQRLIDDDACQDAAGLELVRPAGDIPGIADPRLAHLVWLTCAILPVSFW